MFAYRWQQQQQQQQPHHSHHDAYRSPKCSFGVAVLAVRVLDWSLVVAFEIGCCSPCHAGFAQCFWCSMRATQLAPCSPNIRQKKWRIAAVIHQPICDQLLSTPTGFSHQETSPHHTPYLSRIKTETRGRAPKGTRKENFRKLSCASAWRGAPQVSSPAATAQRSAHPALCGPSSRPSEARPFLLSVFWDFFRGLQAYIGLRRTRQTTLKDRASAYLRVRGRF